MKIVASAPGKLVVSGEYAVLAGAPALAVAIDRRVVCTLADAASDWHFLAQGFAGDTHHRLAALLHGPMLTSDDPGYLVQHVVREMTRAGVATALLPARLRFDIDSRAGFEAGRKLGIGTSAAVTTAVTAALLALCKSDLPPFSIAHRAHRQAQGGRGSGIDIAAACCGGLVRYEAERAERGATTLRLEFPPGIAFATIWTGTSAATVDYLQRFESWRGSGTPAALEKLIGGAVAVADALPDAARFMRQLRAYVAALQDFDAAAQLGIYSSSHQALTAIGTANGVVYKPCGAGGGDFGMAFALDRHAVESFARAASGAGHRPLPLEVDEHGVTVGIEG